MYYVIVISNINKNIIVIRVYYYKIKANITLVLPNFSKSLIVELSIDTRIYYSYLILVSTLLILIIRL
jgi:hypothetical protein